MESTLLLKINPHSFTAVIVLLLGLFFCVYKVINDGPAGFKRIFERDYQKILAQKQRVELTIQKIYEDRAAGVSYAGTSLEKDADYFLDCDPLTLLERIPEIWERYGFQYEADAARYEYKLALAASSRKALAIEHKHFDTHQGSDGFDQTTYTSTPASAEEVVVNETRAYRNRIQVLERQVARYQSTRAGEDGQHTSTDKVLVRERATVIDLEPTVRPKEGSQRRLPTIELNPLPS